MTAPRVWKRGFVTTAAVLVVVVLGAGVAHADVVFRKKVPAATDDTGLEGSPSGSADGTAPAEGASGSAAAQAEDKDTPEAQAQREKSRADAALARQMRNAQLEKQKEGPPLYQKWQFWAIVGAVVVGGGLAIWGGSAVLHQMNGGDIKGCSPQASPAGCYGEGR